MNETEILKFKKEEQIALAKNMFAQLKQHACDLRNREGQAIQRHDRVIDHGFRMQHFGRAEAYAGSANVLEGILQEFEQFFA